MIQCADAHLFCRDCVRAQAGAAVGSRQKVSIAFIPIHDRLMSLAEGHFVYGLVGLQAAFPCTRTSKMPGTTYIRPMAENCASRGYRRRSA